jgi:hypothetical protein
MLLRGEIMIDATGYTTADLARLVCDDARLGLNPLPETVQSSGEAVNVLRVRLHQALSRKVMHQIDRQPVTAASVEGTHDPEVLRTLIDGRKTSASDGAFEDFIKDIDYRAFRERLLLLLAGERGNAMLRAYVELQFPLEGWMGFDRAEAAERLQTTPEVITNLKKVLARLLRS